MNVWTDKGKLGSQGDKRWGCHCRQREGHGRGQDTGQQDQVLAHQPKGTDVVGRQGWGWAMKGYQQQNVRSDLHSSKITSKNEGLAGNSAERENPGGVLPISQTEVSRPQIKVVATGTERGSSGEQLYKSELFRFSKQKLEINQSKRY